MVRNKIVALGGGIVFLLLPLFLFSYSRKGLSLSYAASDNLYFLTIKESGSIITLSPFMSHSGLFDFRYKGNFYIVNFNTYNLFIENTAFLQKSIYLPGVGNKNSTYIQLHNLLTPSYEMYQYTTLIAGNSLNVYLLNRFLFSPEVKIQYRYFASESLPNYYEPYTKSSLSLPLPYFFLIPGAGFGAKIYESKTLPFYRLFSRFNFPLTLDLSLEAVISYCSCSFSDGEFPLTISYTDEPFFEEEAIQEQISATLAIKKLFLKEKIEIDIQLHTFEKTFFTIEDLPRNDAGAYISLFIVKTLDPSSSFSLSLESLFNSSSLDDFDYTKNSIGLQYSVTF